MCLWQTDLCACLNGSQVACCKSLLSIIDKFSHQAFSLALLTLYFYQCRPPVQAHSWDYSDPGPGPAFCQIIGRCCGGPLFCYFQLLLCVCMCVSASVCARNVCWAMLPHMYLWPAAHLCYPGWAETWHPIYDTLHFSLFLLLTPPLTTFPVPLPSPSPPFPFLSESQPPATSLHKSESCLSSREMGPAVCETTDMRYEKWEMREQTDTHAHSHIHSHTTTHTGLYSCIRNILGWISLDTGAQWMLAAAVKCLRLCGTPRWRGFVGVEFTLHN